ncbi:MAG: DUF2079 domain-containing protein [Bdellovibrionota bacterium]
MVLWDFLFLLLVLAPLVTGGIWITRPGLHLEYTQPGAAAVVLVLALWWMSRNGSEPAKKSRVCRVGSHAWNGWKALLDSRPFTALAAVWLFTATTSYVTGLLRHRGLGSGLADLGIFTNAVANVQAFGFPFSSLKNGQSLLTDHQDFLIYPLGWIFPLWPSPLFLLLLQAMIFSTTGAALYLLGRQRLGATHPVVPWLPFAFLFCGPLRAAVRSDVHPEILMMPFFLFAAYLLQERGLSRRIFGFLFLLLALAAKESAGPVACGIGLAWLLGAGPDYTRLFTRWLGAALLCLGAGVFYFDAHVVPSLFGISYAYNDLYSPLGTTPLAVALSPFTQPTLFLSRLVNPARIKYFFGTLLPLAGLPMLAPVASLAAVPGFLMLFLTNGDHRISLGYHYSIEPMVGLLFAVPVALASETAQRWKHVLLPVIVLAGLISYGRGEAFYWRIYVPTPHQIWLRDEILPLVPRDRSVSASYGFVPQLAVRRWVNQIPFFTDEASAPVECALIDREVNNTPLSLAGLYAARARLLELKYTEDFRCGTFSLYRRPDGPACLSSPAPACPEKE